MSSKSSMNHVKSLDHPQLLAIMTPMEAGEVVSIYRLLDSHQIPVWIDGGWGIDALIGHQTRPHNDLDIAVEHRHVAKLREILFEQGYVPVASPPGQQDFMFVLQDKLGRKLDVHSFTFDAAGNHLYGVQYPAASLTGTGTIAGLEVRCVSLEYVLIFHGAYEPDEEDRKDIQALVNRFGVRPPKNYC